MDKPAGIAQIKAACNAVSVELMKIHPAIASLGDKAAQDEIIKTLYELTKNVEMIKKRVLRLGQEEQKDL